VDKLDTYKTGTFVFQDVSKGEGMWYMPFVDFSGKMGSKWAYSLGLRANYFSFTEKLSVEPTAMIQRKMGQKASLQLTYSRQSQLLTPPQYFRFSSASNQFFNKDKDFIKSDNLNLTYTQRFPYNIHLSLTAFGQEYQNIFVLDPQFPQQDYWSILDGFGGTDNYGGTAGTAQSIGIEATIHQNNVNGWFWQLNATLFDATLKEPSRTRSMGYNSKYIFNGYIGKEWTLGSRQNRFLGVGNRTILRGGNWQHTPNNFAYIDGQVAPYFRTDLNVYVKRNRKNWSSTLQLDIQNVTNLQNEQYYYFDSFTQKVTPQYQLGLIPNLSYKIAF
jgi:hypothetical protein